MSDAFEERLNRVELTTTRLTHEFDQLGSRLDSIDARLTGLNRRIGELDDRLEALRVLTVQRFDEATAKIDRLIRGLFTGTDAEPEADDG